MLKSLPAYLAAKIDFIALTFAMERFLTTDLPAVQNWYVVAAAFDWNDLDEQGDPKPETVARISIVKGSLVDSSLWDQLDAIEADLETVAGTCEWSEAHTMRTLRCCFRRP